MQFPDSVLTKSRKGRWEVRAVDSRGRYVICKYLDPDSLKLADMKKKLCLMEEGGGVQEYFIVPIKGQRRSLLIEAEKEEKERKVWNEETQQEEELWK